MPQVVSRFYVLPLNQRWILYAALVSYELGGTLWIDNDNSFFSYPTHVNAVRVLVDRLGYLSKLGDDYHHVVITESGIQLIDTQFAEDYAQFKTARIAEKLNILQSQVPIFWQIRKLEVTLIDIRRYFEGETPQDSFARLNLRLNRHEYAHAKNAELKAIYLDGIRRNVQAIHKVQKINRLLDKFWKLAKQA